MRHKDVSRRGFLSKSLAAASACVLAHNTRAYSLGRFEPAPNVEAWLNAHTNVREAITWWFLGPTPGQLIKKTYSSWAGVEKSQLQKLFEVVWSGEQVFVDDPPKNLSPKDQYPATVLSTMDAWQYHLYSVAHSLAVEIGNKVPWSVTDYSAEKLAIIFDGSWVYLYDASLKGMRVNAKNNGYYTPSNPFNIWQFLKTIGAVGAPSRPPVTLKLPGGNTTTPQSQTIKNVTLVSPRRRAIAKVFDWARYNLQHANENADPTTAQMEAIWGYSGFPPVSAVIKGTINTAPGSPTNELRHWTAGCIGTTGFLSAVMRNMNIPVKHVQVCGHSIPVFTSENATLTHGDDLYDGFTRAAYPTRPLDFPSEEILITQQRFNELFGDGVANRCDNIGRRPVELGVKYLTYPVVINYCKDKKSGASKAGGEVFKLLKPYFSMAELEATDLWGRLEKKLMEGFDCGGYYKNPYS